MMIQDSFVALDFETANYKRTSVCSVGMVKVVNHELTETFYTLVNPNDYFSPKNIDVHGIQPEDVLSAPDFKYVYPYMLQFIDQLPVVAHNAAFDMSVLHASLKAHQFETPDLTYFLFVSTFKKNSSIKTEWIKTYDGLFSIRFSWSS